MDCNPTICREKLIKQFKSMWFIENKVATIAFRFYRTIIRTMALYKTTNADSLIKRSFFSCYTNCPLVFLYFAFLNIHRWLNIANIIPHSSDDGVIFWPSTRPKNAIPRWYTGRKWHIPMASNRKRSRGRIKAYDMGQGEGPIVPLQWCTGRE